MKKYLFLILFLISLSIAMILPIYNYKSNETIYYDNDVVRIYTVYLKGEVKSDKVELPKGTKLKDFIYDYILDTADISSLDLDEEIKNNNVYVITTKGKININTATLKELKTLNGIGDVYGNLIINNRPYKSVSDLENILKSGVYEKIKDDIVCE